ncbi:MAG: DUF368 domain-containing protein [Tenericutes bacterium]|nr:DUF368 domain-containing protein [Mycoplasmatota bacterium]
MVFFELILKGFFIGIAFIIPGLSGGTLAIYLGVYEKLLHSIGNIFKEFKKSIKFLFPVFLGIGISVILLAKLFSILIEWNSFIVLLFFIGLIIGGVKPIYKKASTNKLTLSSSLSFLISFSLIILLVVFEKTGEATGIDYININFKNLLLVFFIGMAASMTMIVPGISGSALLLVLGYYTAIVSNVVGNIFDFSSILYNLEVIIPFTLGAAVSIILFSKIIEYCFKRFHSQSYYAVLGFILASCIAIFFEIKDPSTAASFEFQIPVYKDIFGYISNNIFSLLGGLFAGVTGYFLTKLLIRKEQKLKEASNE